MSAAGPRIEFYQAPPCLTNRHEADALLRSYLRWRLPAAVGLIEYAAWWEAQERHDADAAEAIQFTERWVKRDLTPGLD